MMNQDLAKGLLLTFGLVVALIAAGLLYYVMTLLGLE